MVETRNIEVANTLRIATEQAEQVEGAERAEYISWTLGERILFRAALSMWAASLIARKSAGRKELPILIEESREVTRYDTGAEANFMSKAFVARKSLKLHTTAKDKSTFRVANGKKITSLGKVEACCAFAGEPETRTKCVFDVLEKVAEGNSIIMGRKFLSDTRTLSSFPHRLRARVPAPSTPTVNSIGATTKDSCCQLICTIDERRTFVTPDTGSDLDIMSLEYAHMHDYRIDRIARQHIQLGNGSTTRTYGQTEAVIEIGGSSYRKTFDILPKLTSDVILGELTLEEMEAYTKHEDDFVEVDVGKRFHTMNPIIALGKLKTRFPRRNGHPLMAQKGRSTPNRLLRGEAHLTTQWI